MSTFIQDLRYACRTLLASPSFAAVAIVTLAIGIGVNAAMFSLVEAALLRPLPFPQPNELVLTRVTHVGGGPEEWNTLPWSYPKYQTLRDASHAYAGLAAFAKLNANLTNTDEPERLSLEAVSANYFPVLGLNATVGRTFATEEDATPGTHPVVILGGDLWRRRFNADPKIVGTTLYLNQKPLTVIGVVDGFRGLTATADAWTPMMMTPALYYPEALEERWSHWLDVVGRLAPGTTLAAARQETAAIGKQVAEAHPAPNGSGEWGAEVLPLAEARTDPGLRASILILFGAVGFVLLIGCANIANLQLARSTARRREIAVRLAVGASRGRLVRQLLTESTLLGVMGGGVGLLLASWGLGALVALRPARMAGFGVQLAQLLDLESSRIDTTVLLFTLAVSLLTGTLFGLFPALRATRPELTDDLKASGTAVASSAGGRFSGRGLLVVGEVALALVLLVGAGLMIRSLAHLHGINPGFDPHNVLTLRIDLPDSQYTRQQASPFHEQLLARIESLPGVESASVNKCTPLSNSCNGTVVFFGPMPKDFPAGAETPIGVHYVGPDYFKTLRIPVLQGRVFTARDRKDAPKVLLINETAARTFWPGQDAIGRRISLGIGLFRDGEDAEIVGVVGDVKYGELQEPVKPAAYVSDLQYAYPSTLFLVRAGGDPMALVPAIRREVLAMDANLPIADIKTMDERAGDALSRTRFSAMLLSAFSAIAMILAALGVYGVMAYGVSQRQHEIGIRMALGAKSLDVLRLVLGQGLLLTLIGVALGLALAIGLTRVLGSLLHGVSATDPATFAGVAGLLLGVAVLASVIPARRATRVDPMIALRNE